MYPVLYAPCPRRPEPLSPGCIEYISPGSRVHARQTVSKPNSTQFKLEMSPPQNCISISHRVFSAKKMSKSEEGSCRGVISRSKWQLLSKAHKVILAAPSPMFPKRNRHPHPLIYVWGLNFNPSHIDQWMRVSVSFGKHLNLKSTQGASHFSPV